MLPKKTAEFADVAYWNEFFKERQNAAKQGKSSAFEWYGDFKNDLAPLVRNLHLRRGDKALRALVPGCGNSTLSEELVSSGFADEVVSVDFSKAAIDEMVTKTRGEPRLKWLLGDVTALPIDFESSFAVVWDKGALDALLGDVDGDKPNLSLGIKMLKEAARCMCDDGFYFCVSLLQDHVLKALLDEATSSGIYDSIRLTTSLAKTESVLCPFLVILHKAESGSFIQPQFFVTVDSSVPVSREAFEHHIREIQIAYKARRDIKLVKPNYVGLRGSFSIASSLRPGHERFKLQVIDTTKTKIPVACLVLPQGREHEWSFSNEEGQIQIAESNGIGRLIFVSLARNEVFSGDLESVQMELSSSIIDFAPANLPRDFKIPFMGIAQDIGKRIIRSKGKSETSGPFVVEDVEVQGETYRRLIFENNPLAIQSEVRLSPAGDIDKSFLSFDFHKVMIDFVSAAFDGEQTPQSVLVCGLGGGALFSVLKTDYPGAVIRGVDIDGDVVEAAQKWFGLTALPDELIVADALNILADRSISFNVVLVDINGGMGPSSSQSPLRFPPEPFLERTLLESIKSSLLKTGGKGLLLLNFGCRNDDLTKKYLRLLRDIFEGSVLMADLGELTGDLNMIIACSTGFSVREKTCQLKVAELLKKRYGDIGQCIQEIQVDGSTASQSTSSAAAHIAVSAKKNKKKSKKKKS